MAHDFSVTQDAGPKVLGDFLVSPGLRKVVYEDGTRAFFPVEIAMDGESAGHPFRGNQYTKGHGNDPNSGMKKVDTESKEFRDWFGDSKVVDENGKPIVCYHGTSVAVIQSFHVPENGVAYFTPSTSYGYVQRAEHVIPVYLSIKNPYRTDHQRDAEGAGSWPDWIKELKAAGYDGIIYSHKDNIKKGSSGWSDDHPQYCVFSPHQIKSAVTNTGRFGAHGTITDGESSGHAFRGNQYVKVGAAAHAASKSAKDPESHAAAFNAHVEAHALIRSTIEANKYFEENGFSTAKAKEARRADEDRQRSHSEMRDKHHDEMVKAAFKEVVPELERRAGVPPGTVKLNPTIPSAWKAGSVAGAAGFYIPAGYIGSRGLEKHGDLLGVGLNRTSKSQSYEELKTYLTGVVSHELGHKQFHDALDTRRSDVETFVKTNSAALKATGPSISEYAAHCWGLGYSKGEDIYGQAKKTPDQERLSAVNETFAEIMRHHYGSVGSLPKVWQELHSLITGTPSAKPVSVSKPKPVSVSKPKPVSVSKPKPAPVSKPKPVSVSKPKPAPVSKPKPVSVSKPAPGPFGGASFKDLFGGDSPNSVTVGGEK